jgi:nucleoside diphosphate kinase
MLRTLNKEMINNGEITFMCFRISKNSLTNRYFIKQKKYKILKGNVSFLSSGLALSMIIQDKNLVINNRYFTQYPIFQIKY